MRGLGGEGGDWRTRGPASALRHRDFAWLWSGQTVSVAGDGIFTVALAVETLRVDDRSFALALVLAARLVPTVLLLLVGGVVVDRVPRRMAMLASDAVRGVAVSIIAVLVAVGSLRLGGLVVMSIVFGTADAFFSPASTALVPELLPEELFVHASALSSLSRVFAQQLLGPALGGVIVAAAGTAWSFGLDGASFAVSAGCLLVVRSRSRPSPSGHSALEEAREGLSYVRSQPWLWATLVGAGLANFAIFSPLGVLIPLLVRHVLWRRRRRARPDPRGRRGWRHNRDHCPRTAGAAAMADHHDVDRMGRSRPGRCLSRPGGRGMGSRAPVCGRQRPADVRQRALDTAHATTGPRSTARPSVLRRLAGLDRAQPPGHRRSGRCRSSDRRSSDHPCRRCLASLAGLCLLIPGVRDPDREPPDYLDRP